MTTEEKVRAKWLQTQLQADSGELNALLTQAERDLRGLGYGLGTEVVVDSNTILRIEREGLTVRFSDTRILNILHCDRPTRCLAAMAVPRLLTAMVKAGEEMLQEVAVALTVMRETFTQPIERTPIYRCEHSSPCCEECMKIATLVQEVSRHE